MFYETWNQKPKRDFCLKYNEKYSIRIKWKVNTCRYTQAAMRYPENQWQTSGPEKFTSFLCDVEWLLAMGKMIIMNF